MFNSQQFVAASQVTAGLVAPYTCVSSSPVQPLSNDAAIFANMQSMQKIDLSSSSFLKLRRFNFSVVDKTSAIANLLANVELPYVFFIRPRKFGKSFTLKIAAEMLAAGSLPENVQPWPGYKPVDIDATFSGLDVYQRYKRNDSTLGDLMRQAHFVVKLSLGTLVSESDGSLKTGIITLLSEIARNAFLDSELEKKVLSRQSCAHALITLIDAVPEGVPIAVIVDGQLRIC